MVGTVAADDLLTRSEFETEILLTFAEQVPHRAGVRRGTAAEPGQVAGAGSVRDGLDETGIGRDQARATLQRLQSPLLEFALDWSAGRQRFSDRLRRDAPPLRIRDEDAAQTTNAISTAVPKNRRSARGTVNAPR